MQSNFTYFLRHHTGQEHKESKLHNKGTAQAESQEVSSFSADSLTSLTAKNDF